MTKSQYFDDLNSTSLFGSMIAICHSQKKGFLNLNEKVKMTLFFTDYHKRMHKNQLTLKETQQKVLSDINELFTYCLSNINN